MKKLDKVSLSFGWVLIVIAAGVTTTESQTLFQFPIPQLSGNFTRAYHVPDTNSKTPGFIRTERDGVTVSDTYDTCENTINNYTLTVTCKVPNVTGMTISPSGGTLPDNVAVGNGNKSYVLYTAAIPRDTYQWVYTAPSGLSSGVYSTKGVLKKYAYIDNNYSSYSGTPLETKIDNDCVMVAVEDLNSTTTASSGNSVKGLRQKCKVPSDGLKPASFSLTEYFYGAATPVPTRPTTTMVYTAPTVASWGYVTTTQDGKVIGISEDKCTPQINIKNDGNLGILWDCTVQNLSDTDIAIASGATLPDGTTAITHESGGQEYTIETVGDIPMGGGEGGTTYSFVWNGTGCEIQAGGVHVCPSVRFVEMKANGTTVKEIYDRCDPVLATTQTGTRGLAKTCYVGLKATADSGVTVPSRWTKDAAYTVGDVTPIDPEYQWVYRAPTKTNSSDAYYSKKGQLEKYVYIDNTYSSYTGKTPLETIVDSNCYAIAVTAESGTTQATTGDDAKGVRMKCDVPSQGPAGETILKNISYATYLYGDATPIPGREPYSYTYYKNSTVHPGFLKTDQNGKFISRVYDPCKDDLSGRNITRTCTVQVLDTTRYPGLVIKNNDGNAYSGDIPSGTYTLTIGGSIPEEPCEDQVVQIAVDKAGSTSASTKPCYVLQRYSYTRDASTRKCTVQGSAQGDPSPVTCPITDDIIADLGFARTTDISMCNDADGLWYRTVTRNNKKFVQVCCGKVGSTNLHCDNCDSSNGCSAETEHQ